MHILTLYLKGKNRKQNKQNKQKTTTKNKQTKQKQCIAMKFLLFKQTLYEF
jgi:hypothetical protein